MIPTDKRRTVPLERPAPPTFTEREWKFLRWIVTSIAWIPSEWTAETKSVAKKLDAFITKMDAR